MNQISASCVVALASLLSSALIADDVPSGRLLLIGIDGCRPDALESAQTPHIDALIRNGCWTKTTQILGERYGKNDTISGPGWSSFLTGVWADRHGVHDNTFEGRKFDEYPHLFQRIRQAYPKALLGSFVDWAPIDRFIVQDADVRVVLPSEGADQYARHDKVLARSAVEFLSKPDAHAAMVYFGATDETGHAGGFHPNVPEYISAIEQTDALVGELIDAVNNRPNSKQENWLVVVSTDHGGKNKGHSDGHSVPEIRTTFLIVSGNAAQKTPITQQTYVVDVAATGLAHLGIAIRPEWKLDGRPVGLNPTDNKSERKVSFREDVAPILTSKCLECHSGVAPEGGLNLTSRALAFKGGENGIPLHPGKPTESLLWNRIHNNEMPPEHPLTTVERDIIKRWIASGANWEGGEIDRFGKTTANRAGSDWWSLQPLQSTTPPGVAGAKNPIDAFVRARLNSKGLKPSPRATPEVLIRRLSFDLTGLPPSPSQVTEFLAAWQKDADSAADSLVDQLLASPHFGERWGRHWLDVVRFGESQGFERDKLRSNSWYYRDWVIDALNSDMPYDEFARRQLAGDVIGPKDPAYITATGFLVAGPWDEVGQSQRSQTMKAIVRQDEIEDYVGTISQTFLGLTVNCARCHDHKFDPILQKEYYQLAAAVGGVRHGQRSVNTEENRQQLIVLKGRIREVQDKISQLEQAVRNRLLKEQEQRENLPKRVRPIARWDFESDLRDSIGELHATQHPDATIEDGRLVLNGGKGYAATHHQSFLLGEKTIEAWVKLDGLDQKAGAAISVHSTDNEFDAIVYAERKPRRWMAGSDFFKRTTDLSVPAEDTADNEFIHMAITYATDGTISCYRNGKPYGKPYRKAPMSLFHPNMWYVMFGIRTGGPNPKNQLRGWLEAAQLYDRALTSEQIEASWLCEKAAVTHDSILAALTPDEVKRRTALTRAIANLKAEQKRREAWTIYANVPRPPDTAFVLKRGNPATPGPMVSPAGIGSLKGIKASFELKPDSADAERRQRLADWVTSKDNPLFARVIVNRLWHYHFGRGLVQTPNDFGFNGGKPSHPLLLDWLANELIRSQWSLKHIHRLIVTSATFQQASRSRSECMAVDADNRLLWRRAPQRLEAEALRDAVLSVAGQLNTQYGGPPYRDFETFSNNSQFYSPVDPDTRDACRRTVYRTWIRSGRNPFLDTFDCPDPSATAPKRAVTITPIQSLAMMNNSFVLRMANRFAQRLEKEAASPPAQIRRMCLHAWGRAATNEEIEQFSQFAKQHGLSALCRVVLNSNEFIYVD